MKHSKKVAAILLAGAAAFSLAACGSSEEPSDVASPAASAPASAEASVAPSASS